jgi:hypothetical protein
MCNGRVRRRIWGGYQGRVEADSPTPETTKPSYFYEGFVLYGGTRRTVAVSGARFSAGLEFGGKFGVPQLVTINKSASYGFRWSRTRDFFKVSARCPPASKLLKTAYTMVNLLRLNVVDHPLCGE